MAKIRTMDVSTYKRRAVMSWETMLSIENFRRIKNESLIPVKMVSIFGNDKPVDVVLVVADNPRAAAEAAVFMHNQVHKFGVYPCVIFTPGFCTPQRLKFAYSMVDVCMQIMQKLGVPAEILNFISPDYSEGNIEGIKATLEKYSKLKNIVVFSSRGFATLVAQELLCQLPKVNWKFFENPVVLEKNRIFDVEIISPEGLAIDLMIANISKSHMGWYVKKLPLYANNDITKDELRVVKKTLEKGYAAAMTSYQDWMFYGFDVMSGIEMSFNRQEEVMHLLEDPERIDAQIERIVQQFKMEDDIWLR